MRTLLDWRSPRWEASHGTLLLLIIGAFWVFLTANLPGEFGVSLLGAIYQFFLWLFVAGLIYSRAFGSRFEQRRKDELERTEKKVEAGLTKNYQYFIQVIKIAKADGLRAELVHLKRALNRRASHVKFQTDWNKISKFFYNLYYLCEEEGDGKRRSDNLAKTAIDLHQVVRRMLQFRFRADLLQVCLVLAVFATYLIGLKFTSLMMSLLSSLNKDWGIAQGYYEGFLEPIYLIALGIVGGIAVYRVGNFWLRSIVEKTTTQIDDIIAGIVIGPLSLVTFAILVHNGLSLLVRLKNVQSFGASISNMFASSPLRAALTIILLTWLMVVIFNRLVIYLLRRVTQATEQKYDDMFVLLFQIYGSFVIVAFGLAVLLFAIRDVFGGNFTADVVLPYTIIVSVFSAVLGYASKDALENFIGGALISIDKPFELGERIVLPTGEICDVIEVGMRSTKLYNVIENTEIYIPNVELANAKITNLSRPDSELRIQVPVYITSSGANVVSLAEDILIDIAYVNREVDNARLDEKDLSAIEKEAERTTIYDEYKKLEAFESVRRTILKLKAARAVRGVSVGRPLDLEEIIAELIKRREEFQTCLRSQQDAGKAQSLDAFKVRRKTLRKENATVSDGIIDRFEQLEEAVAAISDAHPEMRDEIRPLASEIARDPDIYSQFGITDDGRSYIRLNLVVFSTHLERRFEVVHILNKQIEERFRDAGIPLLENPPKDLR